MALDPIQLPTIELPTEDGEPLESGWHRAQINLLIESLRSHWHDRSDFYAGGNMFIYYSFDQVRKREYRGPDFYVVLDVDGTHSRGAWVVWEEGGRYPNVIVELLSPSTAEIDKTVKKTLYEQTFRTPEYFWYDPDTKDLQGWRLSNAYYEQIEPNEQGWLWSRQLGLWIGRWEGEYQGEFDTWLRFYDGEGQLVLLPAEAERQRAEAERHRAEQAEAELARLKMRLQALGVEIPER